MPRAAVLLRAGWVLYPACIQARLWCFRMLPSIPLPKQIWPPCSSPPCSKEIVVFKEGYRSRSYCLSECTQVCALTINPQGQPSEPAK